MRACVAGAWSPGGRAVGRQRLEMLAHQLHQRIVRQVPRRGDQQIGGRVHGPVIIADHLAVEALHRLARAQDGLAQRMILPEVGREDFVDQVIRAVRLHLDFFQDDALFLVDVFIAE